ncbi:leucyl/phenylalanyl-tRNA--protein transferase [Idiomarina seosinensis]|uniref:leucyl/phenylalanyl-tRNA--protein transferase n=1 Tax=Idiomarina seosinensis TaxID=281739 RepID=UPI0038515E8E
MIVQLNSRSISFPPPATALHEPNGLLAVGGDLSPARLMHAYRQGIFPWFGADDPILWWSPDPRAVFLPDSIHCSKSLRKALRKENWRVTINRNFALVVQACAEIRSDQEGTWITDTMKDAYQQLHQLGNAHSVEVWLDGQLVGGLYGIAVGRAFCGESMFHRYTNASKVALKVFAEHFAAAGGLLIDCQVSNPHLTSLGACEIDRDSFLNRLQLAAQQQMPQDFWITRQLPQVAL